MCPEVEGGLGVPRETTRLVGEVAAPRLITRQTNRDLTERIEKWADRRLAWLEQESLCGFIFKSRSPSCSLAQVKIYGAKGAPVKKGVGLFARAFMEHFPLLPVTDEGRLHDPGLRENFIEAVFTLKRWRESLDQGRSRGNLVDFHTRHKLLIRSHSPKHLGLLGKLVAQAAALPLEELFDRYQTLLLKALRLQTTVKKNIDVLYHLTGYFKKLLSGGEKEELRETIDHYRHGYVPLIVPVTLINHYVRKYDQPYLKDQYYLQPHPIELKLRNHA